MSALGVLGIRLIRAGGPLRSTSIVAANAVGALLGLVALALPGAVYPPGAEIDTAHRTQMVAIVAFLLVPAVVLLLTVARLSSGVRDRRLASLRLLGLSTARTVVVATVENGVLALAGALVGVVGFHVAAPVADDIVARGPGWFVLPLQVPAGTVALTVAVVALVSIIVSAAPIRSLQVDPRGGRTESARRDPSRRRLALPVGAAVALWWLSTVDVAIVSGSVVVVGLLVGALAGAVAVALGAPVLASMAARWLARSRWVPGLLAGRAMQTEPAGSGRVAAGVAVAVYLVVAAAAVLGAYQSTPQFRYAAQVLGEGPQPISLWSASDFDETTPLETFTPAQLDEIAALPGVRAVVPDHEVVQVGCDPRGQGGPRCAEIFVGTCDDLSHLMVMTGCQDDLAARVDATNNLGGFVPDAPNIGDAIKLASGGADTDDSNTTVTVPLHGDPISYDVQATADRDVYAGAVSVFVPENLVTDLVGLPSKVEIIADGGMEPRQVVADYADTHGFTDQPYPTIDYDEVMRVRAIVWTLSALAVGTGLLSLALTSVDRALERRRAVARQVAIGVPARVLRTGQLLQVLVPLAAGLALAIACGTLLLRAYIHLVGLPAVAARDVLDVFLPATIICAFLVALATVPLIRSTTTAEDLRRE